MGENVNPIEQLISTWVQRPNLGEKADPSWADGYVEGRMDCAKELQEAIKPYLPQPGPPTEPGDYWVKFIGKGCTLIMYLRQYDIEKGEIWFGVYGLLLIRDIEWHCKIMPPFGEVPK